MRSRPLGPCLPHTHPEQVPAGGLCKFKSTGEWVGGWAGERVGAKLADRYGPC